MQAIEKICVTCGRRFIVRKPDSDFVKDDSWKNEEQCILCRKEEFARKEKAAREKVDKEWKEQKQKKLEKFEAEFSKRNNTIALSDISFSDDKVLYIIGNGFDLMHGVKSSYYSFRDFLGKNSSLRETLEDFWTPEDIWADLENGLAKINTNVMVSRFMVDNWLDDSNYFREEDSATNFYMAVENSVWPIQEVATELPKKLRAWVKGLKVGTDDRPLKKLIHEGKALNFNYTEFIRDLYEVKNVCYIHGCREKKNGLILGHKPGELDIPVEKPRRKNTYHTAVVDIAQERAIDLLDAYDKELTKNTDEIIASHADFFNSLDKITSVVVIGHSMSEVDWDYFEEVKKSVKSDAVWYFGIHGWDDLRRMDKLITKLGVKDYRIFRTDKIQVSFYPEEKKKEKTKSSYKRLCDAFGWRLATEKNLFKITKHEGLQFEVVIDAPISKAVFSLDGKSLLLISHGFEPGIQLLRYDGQWKYIDELEPIPHQNLINKRLRKVYMTNEDITFAYNNMVRKYSLIDGRLIYRNHLHQAYLKEYAGKDVTGWFMRKRKK